MITVAAPKAHWAFVVAGAVLVLGGGPAARLNRRPAQAQRRTTVGPTPRLSSTSIGRNRSAFEQRRIWSRSAASFLGSCSAGLDVGSAASPTVPRFGMTLAPTALYFPRRRSESVEEVTS